MPDQPKSPWYALVVRSSLAFKIRNQLRDLAVEEFLPSYFETVRWSDRLKPCERQIFPGYLFVRLDPVLDSDLLDIPGVIQLLPNNISPIAIDEAEIENLRTVLASQVSPIRVLYIAGMVANIVSGVLTGASGTVVKTKGDRVVIEIEMFHQRKQVTVDAEDLEKAA